MAARVEGQAGGADDGAAPLIPSAFENDLMLGATEAIMWIACRRRFSPEMIRELLERRARNLQRDTGSKENPRLQLSPALSNRVDKATLLLFRLIIGGVPATGTLDCEGGPDHEKRVAVPVDFLKDGAYIELLSGHIRADPLLEKHFGYPRPTYRDVDIDRDAFFRALAKGQEDARAQTLPPHDEPDPQEPAETPAPEVREAEPAPPRKKPTIKPRRRGGRKKGSGSLAAEDAPLLELMKPLIASGKAEWAAAMLVVPKAAGAGTDEAKAKRLVARYRESEKTNSE